MADEDTPAEDTSAEDTPAEDTPAEDAPAENAPVEDAPVEDTPVENGSDGETPAEDAAADIGAQEGGSTSASKPPTRAARVAAVVAGAVLASAAAITGAVWAISAIVDDDDDDCCYGDYATAVDPEEWRGVDDDWGPRPDRDRGERAERRAERFDRERSERFDRDRGKRAERDKRGPDKELEERYSSKEADGSEPDQAAAAEGCTTVHRFGSGENAVTILVCGGPGAEWPEFEPGEGSYFRFRKLPQDVFPYFGMGGEQWPFQGRQRPFGPGPMPWDRGGGPFEDGWPFRDGRPREGGPPFDLEEFFRGERFGDGELPFDLEEFFGESVPFVLEEFFGDEPPFDLEEFFEGERFSGGEPPFDLEEFLEERLDRGNRGFRFRSDGTGDGLCFQLGEEQEECIAGLDQLSDEERAQIEQMLEMLEDFGLGGFFDGLQGFLEELESGFTATPTDPAGATSA